MPKETTKKASATLALTILLPADSLDKKLMQRIGRAVQLFITRDKDLQARLRGAAASASDELFPYELEVEVTFDDRDVHLEDQDA